MQVEAQKVRDDDGNRVATSPSPSGSPSRQDPTATRRARSCRTPCSRSHDRLCTVGRTVERATPIETRIEG